MPDNAELAELKLSWATPGFTAEDGIGSLRSLHEAGDAFAALAKLTEDGVTILGSGVMVGPGLLVTASHVLDEFPSEGSPPLFMTFLANGARAWLPLDVATLSKSSEFDEGKIVGSDMALVSCTLNSEAHAQIPLMLAPMQVALPLLGERLWAIGFRHQTITDGTALVTPMISSGRVTAAYPNGRGERMPSPCFEVNMDAIGGMSGGAVVNADGYLVGILSSSFEGGPSYVTLIWDALRLRVRGAIPKLKANETVSLLGAKAMGLAKLKGDVDVNPWGEVTFRLSHEENRLLEDSGATSVRKLGLNEDEQEQFLDQWGSELESIASEATIAALTSLSLPKVRSFLSAADIPEYCLEAIQSFSVEDYEGVDDLELISTEIVDQGRVAIEYFFQLQFLIWTVEVLGEVFRQHEAEFQDHFININDEDAVVSMELVQRSYFRAETVFDQNREEFSEVLITSAAIRPMRSSRRPTPAGSA